MSSIGKSEKLMARIGKAKGRDKTAKRRNIGAANKGQSNFGHAQMNDGRTNNDNNKAADFALFTFR